MKIGIYFILFLSITFISKSQDFVWTSDFSKNIGKLDDIFFYNSNEGLMVEEKLGFALTGNGGVEWGSGMISKSYKHNALFLIKPIYAFVVSANNETKKGAFFSTSSKGLSWIKSDHEFENPLMQLFFFDADNGIVLDDKNNLYITSDRGQTFSSIYSFPVRINEFGFFADKLWAVGDNGSIFFSIDNATSWVSVTIQSEENINSIEILENGDVFLCGDNGFVSKSSNEGETWEIIKKGKVDLNSIDFFDEDHGIVIGGEENVGVCYMTEDGGDSWISESVPDAEYLDVEYLSKDIVVGVGLYHESVDFSYGYIIYGEKATSIQEIDNSNTILYPNPASDRVIICGYGDARIEVLNNVGQVVLLADYVFGEYLDISDLNTGVYYCRIITKNRVEIKLLNVLN